MSIWDTRFGFLPAKDPATNLQCAGYEPIDELGAMLPKLLVSGDLKRQIEHMPYYFETPSMMLRDFSERQCERAMMLFSYFAHAFVWENRPPRNYIPKQIAVPLCVLAKHLGRPPLLSYASYALCNWRRIDTSRPVELGNIVLLQNFLGGMDEEWFVLVHIDIEARASAAIRAASLLQEEIIRKNKYVLEDSLLSIYSSLTRMNETLSRMPENCDPYIYYNRVRPFIHGWKDNLALPNGLIYEGVEEFGNRPMKFRGETGAQSSIVPYLDAVLGITHADKLKNGEPDKLKFYLSEMREYMPRDHRRHIEVAEQNEKDFPFRKTLLRQKKNFPDLVNAYNEIVAELAKFREKHYEYASNYIGKQGEKSSANPVATGTGGTPFMIYLKKHLDETKAALIK